MTLSAIAQLGEGGLARHHGEPNGPMVFPPYRRTAGVLSRGAGFWPQAPAGGTGAERPNGSGGSTRLRVPKFSRRGDPPAPAGKLRRAKARRGTLLHLEEGKAEGQVPQTVRPALTGVGERPKGRVRFARQERRVVEPVNQPSAVAEAGHAPRERLLVFIPPIPVAPMGFLGGAGRERRRT